ncbi:hypothetical protein ACFL6I_21135 [candidate division KSB1 bacterium]
MLRIILKYSMLVLTLFSFGCLVIQYLIHDSDNCKNETTVNEKYDSKLSTVNSIDKCIKFCNPEDNIKIFDSLQFVYRLDSLLKYRFFHGYSRYGFKDNFLIYALSILIYGDVSAIVNPNHLIQKDYAACSQQAIIFMEVLKQRGFKVRKVGLQSHFCSEVYYSGKWHFFDTNQEAEFDDIATVPGIEELINDKSLLYKAYANSHSMDTASIERVFNADFLEIGKENEFPAKRMLLFQNVVRIISNILWLFFLAIFFLIKSKK